MTARESKPKKRSPHKLSRVRQQAKGKAKGIVEGEREGMDERFDPESEWGKKVIADSKRMDEEWLRPLMFLKKGQGRLEGFVEMGGYALLAVLHGRGLTPLTPEAEARIVRCEDREVLLNWIVNAARADSLRDVFRRPRESSDECIGLLRMSGVR